MDQLLGNEVFYSCRAGGPFYRWRYEEKAARWRFSRVQLSVRAMKTLHAANWKGTPPALQRRLNEHYFEQRAPCSMRMSIQKVGL